MFDTVIFCLSLISLICNFIAIIYIIITKIYKKEISLESELLFYLTIACAFDSGSHIIYFGNNSEELLCKTQAFIMVWSRFSVLSLITLITIHIYNELSREDPNIPTNKICLYRSLYLTFAFVPSLTLATFAKYMKYLGTTSQWCWVNSDTGKSFRLVLQVITMMIIIVNMVIAILARRVANRNNHQREYNISYYNQLIWFPIVYMILNIPILIRVIVRIFISEKIMVLQTLILIAETSQGFWYIFVKVIFSPLPKKIYYYLSHTCCKNRKRNSSGINDISVDSDIVCAIVDRKESS